jgi:BirA family biotin operon repressor/biotin-[acetyl-CoA-carboxylase] ligase
MLHGEIEWHTLSLNAIQPGLQQLARKLYGERSLRSTRLKPDKFWQHLLLVDQAPVSQYDTVIRLCQDNIDLPHGLLCLAGSGEKFHGLRNRPWTAMPGNIHLTAHLKPNIKTIDAGVGFTIISALAVIDAIDKIRGLKDNAMIKWVNDIFIEDAKVAGFLTHTLSTEALITSAIIGIGLNVEATPKITLDPTIYRATSLRELVLDPEICNQRIVFGNLTETLENNYRRLVSGELSLLLDRYRERSMILGRDVEILPDSPGANDEKPVRGKVVEIGPNLELFLEGQKAPVLRGRAARII